MSFIIALIEKLKENILLASVICFFFLGGIGIGSYYLFTRSSDNTVQKESEEDQEEEEEGQEENEANTIEEIKPTFLLDYSKTTLVIQIVTELIIIIFILWISFDENYQISDVSYVTFKDFNVFQYDEFRQSEAVNMFFLKILFANNDYRFLLIIFFINVIIYLPLHVLINFLLPLIAKFTSGNDYLYLLDNYWTKHADNLGSYLIFFLSWIIVPFLIIYAAYWYHQRLAVNNSKKIVDNNNDIGSGHNVLFIPIPGPNEYSDWASSDEPPENIRNLANPLNNNNFQNPNQSTDEDEYPASW